MHIWLQTAPWPVCLAPWEPSAFLNSWATPFLQTGHLSFLSSQGFTHSPWKRCPQGSFEAEEFSSKSVMQIEQVGRQAEPSWGDVHFIFSVGIRAMRSAGTPWGCCCWVDWKGWKNMKRSGAWCWWAWGNIMFSIILKRLGKEPAGWEFPSEAAAIGFAPFRRTSLTTTASPFGPCLIVVVVVTTDAC